MGVRMFNGLAIDVPDGWADATTIVVAPADALREGRKPPINLVVKRRPSAADDTERSLQRYLEVMQRSFGALTGVQTKEMTAGAVKGRVVMFEAVAAGTRFRQVTFLFHAGAEEVTATVTQLDGDPTSLEDIEKLLRSVRPANLRR